jgi:predicted nucleic acid-binding protein
LLQVRDLAKLDECVATGDVECIIQLTLAVAASGKAGVLLCSDKSGMIERLRNKIFSCNAIKLFFMFFLINP